MSTATDTLPSTEAEYADLGDGLILRRASSTDIEAIAEFNGRVHGAGWTEIIDGQPGPNYDAPTAEWIRDNLRNHPTLHPEDFTLVENSRTGEIVSTMCLISQVWTYSGIPLKVGQPEMVGTHPEYRRRGLVRAQFETIHRWSADRGESIQVIEGIPWYYRQFGYEMGVTLGGGRKGDPVNLPRPDAGETERCRLRLAKPDDIPFLQEIYEVGTRRDRFAAVRSDADWLHDLQGRSETHSHRSEIEVITWEGKPVGFVAHSPRERDTEMSVYRYELKPGISWAAVTPGLLRALIQMKSEALQAQALDPALARVAFHLGLDHPSYAVSASVLPVTISPYALYLRIPDLSAFLRRIAPALEDRLADSPMAGHSGDLRISFYRNGLRLTFENGRLASVEPWMPDYCNDGDAKFPDLTFLQLIAGYRYLEELAYAFADCSPGSDLSRALLNGLFPKQSSLIWPAG